MRIEYLATIAIAAVAAGTGLAVHSVGSRSPEKQFTPAAAQVATLLETTRNSLTVSIEGTARLQIQVLAVSI